MVKRGKAMNTLKGVEKQLASRPYTTVQLFSATTKLGVDEARDAVAGYFSG